MKNKNGGPDSLQRNRHSYNERDMFLDGKLELNKTQNPNVAAATEFIPKGEHPRVEGDQLGRPQPGLKARRDTRPTWPKIGDATPCRGHIE
jgi:hypothetical protein